MEKVQVRFPREELKRIDEEVREGKYPSKSEAIRDKVRKSYLLEAIIHMRTATEGLDEKESLKKLDATRAEQYERIKKSSS